jgi:hypothetical protein
VVFSAANVVVETTRQAERVLFLPGANGDREFWKPVADRIRHSGDKVLLGWPGFGSNPMDSSIKSLDDLLQSVLQLIDRPSISSRSRWVSGCRQFSQHQHGHSLP